MKYNYKKQKLFFYNFMKTFKKVWNTILKKFKTKTYEDKQDILYEYIFNTSVNDFINFLVTQYKNGFDFEYEISQKTNKDGLEKGVSKIQIFINQKTSFVCDYENPLHLRYLFCYNNYSYLLNYKQTKVLDKFFDTFYKKHKQNENEKLKTDSLEFYNKLWENIKVND